MAAHDTTPATAPMLGTIAAIRQRHSVRAFAPNAVDKSSIRILLDAAVHAPTAMHEEPWAFAVIQDAALLRRLSDAAKAGLPGLEREFDALGHGPPPHFVPPENIFYDAGTLIVIYGESLGPFVVADCWLAAENLMLAACALGLGTCVIGLAVGALNAAEWKAELGVPAELTAYAPIIVGMPAAEPLPTSRRNPRILCWR